MKYIVGLCLIAFPLCGLLLVFAGIRGLWTTWRRSPFLKSVMGEIIKVERTSSQFSGDDSGTQTVIVYVPVVRFTTLAGELKEFRSALGKSGEPPPYRVGTSVAVLYDPDNEIPPMLHTWFSMWGGHVVYLAGGLVFFGGAAMTYAAFGRKVFNGP